LLNEVHFDGSVLDLLVLDERILAVDSTRTLHLIAADSFRFIKKIPLDGDSRDNAHPYAKHGTLSVSNAVAVVEEEHNVVVKSFSKNEDANSYRKKLGKPVEVLKASVNGKYLATGGTDGKVAVYFMNSGQLCAELPTRPDYISALAFSEGSQMLASCCYDKSITFFDLDTNTVLDDVYLEAVVEDCRFFDGNSRLYVIMRDGRSLIYNLEEQRIESQQMLFSDWPTCIQLNENRQYAIVGSRSDCLSVVALENNAVRFEVRMKRHGISMVKLREKYLFVGYIDGTLEVYAYDKHLEDLRITLKVKDFAAARKLVDENIFLQLYPFYIEKFEEGWLEILPKLEHLIGQMKLEEAVAMAHPFLDDEGRQKHFSKLTEACSEIAAFVEAVNGNDYPAAFRLLEFNAWFKELEAYATLEKRWMKTFRKAKDLLCKDPVLNKRDVQVMLKPFTYHDPYMKLIDDLMRYPEVFSVADAVVKQKDFKEYFFLLDDNPFLKETVLHERVMKLGNILLQKSIQLERSGKYEAALEGFKQLEAFYPFAEESQHRTQIVSHKIAMQKAVAEGAYEKAYIILNAQPEVRNSYVAYEQLKEHFEKVLEQAQRNAIQGKVSVVMKLLDNYLPIEFCKYKVLMVLRIAYSNEMRLQRDKMDQVDWDQTIANYAYYFGKDDTLERVCGVLGLSETFGRCDTAYHGGEVEHYPTSILIPLDNYLI
jgi:tetratricopeptide (TPR) repeat protein